MEISDAINQNAKFILVSCDPVKDRDGMSELWHVLIKYCGVTPLEVFSLPVKGLFLLAIKDDIFETFKELRNIIQEKKFEFIVCKKITPIEQLIKSDSNELTKAIPNYLHRIPSNAKWRITLNRRHTTLKRNDLIELVANHSEAPKGPVDLDNPEWIILIEVFGEWLGFGVYYKDPIITTF